MTESIGAIAVEGFEDVINEFLVESYESLDKLDQDLMSLEDAPEDLDRLASIFRTVHTIKGTSGFLAFPKLERVAHVGENLLVPLRDGEIRLSRDMADGLLGMVDAIREILSQIESGGAEGDTDYSKLVKQLEDLRNGESAASPTAPDADSTEAEPTADETATDTATTEATSSPPVADPTEATTVAPTAEATLAASPQPAASVANSAKTEPAETSQAAIAKKTDNPPASKKKPAPAGKSDTKSSEGSPSVADSTVRIDVGLLDKLMNLVGELVLARNQILQFSGESADAAMIAASQRINHITTELQEGVMKTRMQPIRNAWSKLPRVVRDLSATCGKNVVVRMEGADTELDKTILEAIKDPLTHIVRNSVDHGVEPTDVRVANGKPKEGTLLLRAYHEGGQVNIEIIDDGGGINTDRITAKAIEKGLVTAEQAEAMGERELTNLILLPGFSTAEKVTNVSGRGVGMDVVRTNIERIGGTLEISSVPGEGTTLRIKIPLTLAIVPALICRSGHNEYAIPQVSLVELVRLDGERAKSGIEYIHDAPVYRLRGNLLPLVYLDEQLELRAKRDRDEHDENVNIVVLKAEELQFGLVVDAITDTQEIVVKPLGQHLKAVEMYAGATIMGDGTVALILDVVGVAHKSRALSEHGDRHSMKQNNVSNDQPTDVEAFLIVDPGDDTRAAVPLSTVARLEEFELEKIERSGQVDVVQYRGTILPLVYINGSYSGPSSDDAQRLQTVVYTDNDKSIGIVVGRIVDVVHASINVDPADRSARTVIQDRVTEIIDLPCLVSNLHPDF